jgi:hypothetical protein
VVGGVLVLVGGLFVRWFVGFLTSVIRDDILLGRMDIRPVSRVFLTLAFPDDQTPDPGQGLGRGAVWESDSPGARPISHTP